jgi:hypothetical protein
MDMISEAIQMDIPNNPSENVKAAQTAYKQVQRYGLVN